MFKHVNSLLLSSGTKNLAGLIEINVATLYKGLGLLPLAFWGCGFESRRWGAAWMSVLCQCYVLSRRDLCEGPIARTEESVMFLCIIVKPGDRKVKTLNLVGAPKIMNGGEESLHL